MKKSHPTPNPGEIQGAGGAHEPTSVPPKGRQHEIGTSGEAVPNTAARAADPSALDAQNRTQGVSVKTDLSGSPDYARAPLPQGPTAGMGAAPEAGDKFNDGRQYASTETSEGAKE